MDDNNALSLFPKTRIKPYDGMSVTAEVWAQAHEEHRKARQAHDVVFHRPGIITGLEVQANDPPDQYVFISPGVAVDALGNLIVVSEPVAYDFGAKNEGLLYLLIGHGEREAGGVDKEVRQVHAEFVVAARSSLPKRPAVELARVRVNSPSQPIRNAAYPSHPEAGELDTRFRVEVGPPPLRLVTVGLASFGREAEDVAAGWRFLAAECARSSPYRLVIDHGLVPTSDFSAYDLVYLSARGAFSADEAAIRSLRTCLEPPKTLFAEALDEEAHKSFGDLFEKLGLKMAPLPASAALLERPFLFAAPPSGARAGVVQVGRQALYSACAYSQAWAGKLPFEARSRADIRSAHEWGLNLLWHCLESSS
jgi:hypothetical protein